MKHKNLLSYIKMGKKNFMLGDIGIEENKFWEDRDIKKVLVSKKISSGENAINTLLVTCIMMIKLSHYI